MNYLIVLIVGFALGYFVASKRVGKTSVISKQLEESHFAEASRDKKERNKQAIYELMETNSPLTNNDVEAMLGISDATVTRYFDELEKEGKVRQVGKTGRFVSYERI